MTYDESIHTLEKHLSKLSQHNTDFTVWLSTAIEHVHAIFSILSPQYSSITSLRSDFNIEKIRDNSPALIANYSKKAKQLVESFIEQLEDRKKQAKLKREFEEARAKGQEIRFEEKYRSLLPLYESVEKQNEQLKKDNIELRERLAPRRIYFGSENGIYKIRHDIFWIALPILLGGFFTFGLYVGTTKFDKEKITLDKSNEQLVTDTTALRTQLRNITLERDSLLKTYKENK